MLGCGGCLWARITACGALEEDMFPACPWHPCWEGSQIQLMPGMCHRAGQKPQKQQGSRMQEAVRSIVWIFTRGLVTIQRFDRLNSRSETELPQQDGVVEPPSRAGIQVELLTLWEQTQERYRCKIWDQEARDLSSDTSSLTKGSWNQFLCPDKTQDF